ncbi:hypothetical protein R3X28_05755 [Maribacter sp. TH_r10]|uniref:hypothetical protein n=1 Tax=Maribacter TaxID=252356 RepID=UPI002492BEBA|nr:MULTISPECIES: hypothetical protein [Maribacter]MDV7138369.1 hypothetical protein [Maribacter sp. TH_r10]|tara:strand:- start:1727 stop:2032 length:306 start_codon:yes stop_codon:yes gene_type:complete
MKLLMVTVVEQYEKKVMDLFKKAEIENFSGSDIDGYKNPISLMMKSTWFPNVKGGVESSLFFSFTEANKIDVLFELIKEFNENLETNNPIKAIVVPVEKSI